MDRKVTTGLASFLVVAAVGCMGQSATGVSGTGGAGGVGGSGEGGLGGVTASVTTSATTASSTVATSTSGTGGTGGSATICDPPAEAGSLFALEEEGLFDIGKSSLCKYRGEVLLIVNMAGA